MEKIKQAVDKILILGIDALEYDLVERWELRNLMQSEYGKTILPIYPGEDPNTRIIWPCFITGEMPNKMGFVTSKVFKPPLQFFVNIFVPWIKIIFNPQLDNPSNIVDRKRNRRIRFLNRVYDKLEEKGLIEKPSRK
ncbi:MAG TPA: hypothetical protein ENI51_08700, partial [Candidatus Atribacteria bacterium]|nr:hypothetical protein [Candidatus Atribacteria bacterium]